MIMIRSKSVQGLGEDSPLDMFGGGVLYSRRVWLYPDLATLLVGGWDEGGRMLRGQLGEVTSLTCTRGLMRLEARPVPGARVHKYDPPSPHSIASHPLDKVSLINHFSALSTIL